MFGRKCSIKDLADIWRGTTLRESIFGAEVLSLQTRPVYNLVLSDCSAIHTPTECQIMFPYDLYTDE